MRKEQTRLFVAALLGGVDAQFGRRRRRKHTKRPTAASTRSRPNAAPPMMSAVDASYGKEEERAGAGERRVEWSGASGCSNGCSPLLCCAYACSRAANVGACRDAGRGIGVCAVERRAAL